jgi:error-prone DNA polymerase
MTPFVHLRVASGYSLQYGASHPSALVARAAQLGFDTLGLTDRDGLYGAIRFAKACLSAGIAPVIGVDLAVPAVVAPRAIVAAPPYVAGSSATHATRGSS